MSPAEAVVEAIYTVMITDCHPHVVYNGGITIAVAEGT